MSNQLTAALQYLNEGFSIIPVWSPYMLDDDLPPAFFYELDTLIKKNRDKLNPLPEELLKEELLTDWCKRPAIPVWKKFQNSLASNNEVKQWFTKNPTANIGIVTGKVSNLVVVDLDSDEAVKTFRDKGWFDGAGVAKSAHGYHIYFSYPDFEVRNSVDKSISVDIRGEGGYILAPPSVHGSGIEYKWESRNILTQDPEKLPKEIFQYIKKLFASSDNSKSQKNSNQPINGNSLTGIIVNGCDDGERHDSGIRIAGYFFGKGLNEEVVLANMLDWNRKNRPPLTDKEIVQMVNNIAGHEKEKSSAVTIDSFLWDEKRIAAESENKHRISFAGDNLLNLENELSGGLVGGCIYLLGGVPSAGKTAVVNCIADNICLSGHPVLIFSYDDSPMELNNRTLARFSNYTMDVINKQAISTTDKCTAYSSSVLQEIIRNKYMPNENFKIELWPGLIEQIIEKHHKPPVIFIDYLKRLVTKKKSADERMRIDEIIKQLDGIAKKYDLPIFAISELNRESYRAGQNIGMASFKESGGLEYSASWLGVLASFEERNGEYKLIQNWESAIRYSGNIDLLVLKAKRGTGELCQVPLNINTKKMLVTER